MPRAKQFSSDRLVEFTLPVFWRGGYAATSIDDLTQATNANRQAIYGAFQDKRALLLACIDRYRQDIVDPAFAPVEWPGAGLAEIAAYFERQIAAAETHGLPGPGCLLANLATEAAPTDPDIAAAVRAHYARLRAGFRNALAAPAAASTAELDALAALLTTTAQGLWSMSRVCTDGQALRTPVKALLTLIEGALAR